MYKKILIVIDLNNEQKAAEMVKVAQELTGHNPNAVYRVAMVIEPFDGSFVASFLPQGFDKSVISEANKMLHEFTKEHFPKGSKVQHIVAHGTVHEEITRIAHDKSIDLIIMLAKTKKTSLGLDSSTVKVARHSDKPMLLLR
ncbi:universal stress protein [Phocoenobacter skyensis]|uniref:Universal stress protein n=1 Tax=Phocoenobacter skyensis TaxID=97481 RepID=A0A1H7WPQ3_9PAST|nr:universal stress protein [Pasteurella skyensis]MDP8078984.1 universal stress protein [Pasteurella skyensis]MDP8084934.1 universal stress protein [Pasteurella skyensis]MDP8162849.1 universal stress protein [Pasteurella skyensis]MDP8169935.1 universal stress protein [Pasteurella skyensis]MDP8172564.1 universal stress protein [Pasteurella skyensis]